jgi:hypothetical protein
MSQQQKLKVSHHIRKIQEALNVSLSSSDDSSVNLVLDNLLLRYKEYQFESRPELYSVVRTVLMTSAMSTSSVLASSMAVNAPLVLPTAPA